MEKGMNTVKWLLITLLLFSQGRACTSVLVSGAASSTGRPFFWKQRDSNHELNRLVKNQGLKYEYIGLANEGDEGDDIWVGANSAGFAIMNTASYNLVWDPALYEGEMDQEGAVMKEVLGICSSLAEFEIYLDSTNGKRGVEANFGVLDENGDAAYYECSPLSYVKYDVNDSLTAPQGYLIRTNFSFKGEKNGGYGYIRYMTTEKVLFQLWLEGNLSPKALMAKCPRALEHPYLERDIEKELKNGENKMAVLEDYLIRSSTVSSTTIEGGENQRGSSMCEFWLMTGFPLTSVLVPFRFDDYGSLPSCLIDSQNGVSNLAKWIFNEKKDLFAFYFSSGDRYLKLDRLRSSSANGDGLLEKINSFDSITVSEYMSLNDKSDRDGFYKKLDKRIRDFYLKK